MTSAESTQPLNTADAGDDGHEILDETALILYNLFEDPRYFQAWGAKGMPFYFAGEIIMATINILIIVSTLAFCVETMESYSPDPIRNPDSYQKWTDRWGTLEAIMVALFTIDLVVRGIGAYFAGRIRTWLGVAMNWIDFVAIAPFYLSLMLPDMLDLRFVRVIRLVRILKTVPATRQMDGVITDIVSRSVGALFIPVYFMCLALVVFSSVMFFVEQTDHKVCLMGDGTKIDPWISSNTSKGNEGCEHEWGCVCPGTVMYVTSDDVEWTDEMYTSIPDAFWWCIVTFTTVGYGDRYPRTNLGRLVCVVTMFSGIFFLAMPLTIVGTAFQQAWDEQSDKKVIKEAHNRQESGQWSPDPDKVIRNRTNIRAHLLRTSELLNDMRLEAVTSGAGNGVLRQWDKLMDEVGSAKHHFEHVMELYRVN